MSAVADSTAVRVAGPRLHRHVFQAMAVRFEFLLECDEAATVFASGMFVAAERELKRLEEVFSRFRLGSELSRLNRNRAMICTADLYDVVVLALDARRRTAGRFDPTVLRALISAGYDRTFTELPDDGPPPTPQPCDGRIDVDHATRTIRLTGDAQLDLGGIAKGYAAEKAARLLGSGGPALVNAGGDIAIAGVPKGGSWPIAIETDGVPLTLGVASGGVATSGRDVRRWVRGGREQHHLIDPATGLPSESDLLTVTVVAANTVEAEVQAKALFLAGERAAVDEADAAGLPCVLRTGDGRIVRAGGLK